ncbi:amidohydrolase family protein [Pelagicoccus sp. SDUM812003]|uniref:amidohydrolase family protein n=1 Tax=Pelagicoccus sp. SDUM812003 TaxID=3041267 RepID=UPI00280EF879|nr:amidohydrolase family protein [Pelagicoccus sp. SDUM812003]MDQ8205700.1 amidohydrolase family protein [Pelagicoccus sp. SDUM812003]
MIIDAHIHLYPPSVYENPRKWALHWREPYWSACVAPENRRSMQGWSSVDELLRKMDQANVERSVILAWYWENHDTCSENVNWQIEWIKAHPDRLIAFAPFHPSGQRRSIDLLKLAFDAGFKGIGELNPPAQGYAYHDPMLAEALDLAALYEAAVNIHVTDPNTRDYPGKIETPAGELLAMAQRHPKTQFVFAHLAGCMHTEAPFAEQRNIWYDLSASPLLYPPKVYRDFCDNIGSDRLLFGTDFPLKAFPKDPETPDFIAALAYLGRADLSEQEREAILHRNAAKLLHLS